MSHVEPVTGAMWRLGAVIVIGAVMSQLDASVVSVALPTIADRLDAPLAVTQWVATSYLLAFAAALPVGAWAGRRVGVGRLWLAALAGFTVTSALCAAAPTVAWLVAARVAQGAAAGVLIPAGQTVLGQAVGPERLGRVMAALGVAVTLAPALGPVLGGLLVQAVSWQAVFLVNLPLGAAGVIAGWRLVPRGRADPGRRLDRVGLALVSLGVPLIVYGATRWGDTGTLTAPDAWAPLLGGAAAVAVFVPWSLGAANPALELRLFRTPAYATAAAGSAFTGAALFGSSLVFPLYYQVGRAVAPAATGLSLVSLGVGTVVMLPVAGRWVDRYGAGRVAVVGTLGTLATTVPFAVLPLTAPEPALQALLLTRGVALALAAVPTTTAAYAAVSPEQLPDATTQVNILSRVGGALGGALAAVAVAAALPDHPARGLHTAFWVLTAAAVLAFAAAIALRAAESRSARPTTHEGAS